MKNRFSALFSILLFPAVMMLAGASMDYYFNPAAPGAIGGTTPAAGDFTTLGATGASTLLGHVSIGTATKYYRLSQPLELNVASDFGGLAANTWSATASHAQIIEFNRSASATPGTHAILSAEHALGYFSWRGSDGLKFVDAAGLRAKVDGTPGVDDMPGRLEFLTTADGEAAGTIRLIINKYGNASFDATDTAGSTDRLSVGGTLHVKEAFKGPVVSEQATDRFAADVLASAATKKPVLFVVSREAATNNLVDLSGYGNTLTEVGTPPTAVYTGSGLSIPFTGAGGINYGVADRDEFTNAAAATSFVAVANVVDTAGSGTMLAKDDGVSVREWIFYITSEEKPELYLFDTSAGGSMNVRTASGMSVGWHHFAIVYTGGTNNNTCFATYVDGAAVTQANNKTGTYNAVQNTTQDVAIGTNADSNIANVAIYASALSSTEVYLDYLRARALYNF